MGKTEQKMRNMEFSFRLHNLYIDLTDLDLMQGLRPFLTRGSPNLMDVEQRARRRRGGVSIRKHVRHVLWRIQEV